MSAETPSPRLLEAAKASAAKLKEMQSALEARARELDALRVQLETERSDLERRETSLAAQRDAIEREREETQKARASAEADRTAAKANRENLAKEEDRLRDAAAGIEDREKALHLEEERVKQLEQGFSGRIVESVSELRALVEREEELMKAQGNWLAAFETREKELRTISEAMHATQGEANLRHEAFLTLKDAFKDELNRLLAEQEKLAAKEKSLLEAERYLATTLNLEEASEEEIAPPVAEPTMAEAPPPPAPAPPVPSEPEPVPEPIKEEVIEAAKPRPPVTKAEAMEQLGKAVEAWKRARAAGWKVGDIRDSIKAARDAVGAGDYESAVRLATEILEALQAAPNVR
jgi:hypothetical protein